MHNSPLRTSKQTSAAATLARGDASAASVALGGIHFRKEPRISMEKERLSISLNEIKVEYEFLNHSNEDITTDVAFPLADRSCLSYSARSDKFLYGHDPEFTLWVDGAVQKYEMQTQAVARGHVHTALLRKMEIPA